MTVAPDGPASLAGIAWMPVTDDLWVASVGGNFVGTIERIEERYVAVDGRGSTMGVNGSLEAAQARFDPADLVRGRRRRPLRAAFRLVTRLAARISRPHRRTGALA